MAEDGILSRVSSTHQRRLGRQHSPDSSCVAMTAPFSAGLSHIPPLLYGTAWKGEATTSLVLQALASGFKGIDTAGQRKHYREDLVGVAVAQAQKELGIGRELLWLQTKFTPLSGQDTKGPIPYDAEAPIRIAVRTSFENSLRSLHIGDQWAWGEAAEGQDGEASTSSSSSSSTTSAANTATALKAKKRRPWIDSYLLHSPLNSLEETLQAWSTMEELVLEGKVREIGFSNVYDARIFAALKTSAKRVGPRILQNRWHHTSGHDVSLLSLLSPALSPNDFPLPGPANPSQPAGINYQPFWTLTGNPRLLSSDAVQVVAADRNWTPEQVVYRFVAQNFGIPGLHVTVLCGSTNEAHMREAVHAVLSQEGLQAKEVESIRKVIYGE